MAVACMTVSQDTSHLDKRDIVNNRALFVIYITQIYL
jgi:hypothetical protein